jgi:hypothetical protein
LCSTASAPSRVLHVGRVDDDAQQQAKRVDEDVALAPKTHFAGVVARRIERGGLFWRPWRSGRQWWPASGWPHDLLSHEPRRTARGGSAPACRLSLAVQIVSGRAPGWQILGAGPSNHSRSRGHKRSPSAPPAHPSSGDDRLAWLAGSAARSAPNQHGSNHWVATVMARAMRRMGSWFQVRGL